MPEQTISPGVFTEERDQTFLAQGVNQIGGAFIGPTAKGPAFEPVQVESPQDYEAQFGNEGLYMDYSARNYLRDAASATVVRILGEEGYESESVEIELPEGELSKREFQISKATFDFDPQNVQPDEEIDFEICVRGRQRRSTDDNLLKFNITIEEYVDGEFHDTVYANANPLDQDCIVDSFNVSTGDFAEVQYKVTVELSDGQTDTIMSPTGEVQGFYLESANYNWTDGESRGVGEILSLQGTVANRDGGEYSYEIHRNTQNGSVVVDSGDGILNDTFESFWVHDGQAGDALEYAVKVSQGNVVDVSDDTSPLVNIIERDNVSGFEILDANFNVDSGQAVDFGDTIQLDLEASADIQSFEVKENGTTVGTLSDNSQTQNDSTLYTEFDVGDSGQDFSTGDSIQYEVVIGDGSTTGNSTNTDSVVSATAILDGGVLQISEVNWNFDQGDELDIDAGASVEFEISDLNAADYTYEITEIVNPDGAATETSVVGPTTTSDTKLEVEISQSATAVDGDDIAFRIDINTNKDSATSPTQDVVDITDIGSIGFKQVNWSFDAQTVESGDEFISDFFIDGAGETDLDYRIDVIKIDDDGNEVNTGASSADGVSIDTTTQEFFFETWEAGDSGAPLYDGDDFFYRIKLLDSTDSEVATSDSPTLKYSGSVEPIFTFDSYSFQFTHGSDVEPNERLAAFFDVRRPNDELYDYEVVEYVDGDSGTAVASTESEENQDFISDVDKNRIEVGWLAGDRDNGNALVGADEVHYEIVIRETDSEGDPVSPAVSDTVQSGTLNVSGRVPDADVTLAALAPTQRLRSDGDEIFNAQVNPDKADIEGFELILDKDGSSVSTSGGGDFGTQEHEPESEVEELFAQSGTPQTSGFEDDLIEGRTYEVSLNEGDSNYLLDLFGSDPEGVREVYAKKSFPEVWEELIAENNDVDVRATYRDPGLEFEGQSYSNAETPWIVSQDVQPNQPGTERQELFRFETLGDGDFANNEIKVSIRNVNYPSEVPGSDYGQFDVIVRDYEDSDANPNVLESYTGVNLDPTSQNYIARVIGNKETIFREDGKLIDKGGESGVFENRSDLIRVRMNPEVVKANSEGKDGLSQLVPWGYAAYSVPFDLEGELPHGVKNRLVRSVADAETDIMPQGSIDTDETAADTPFESQIHFGFDFSFEGNESFLQAVSVDAPGDEEDNQDLGFVLSDAYVEDPNGTGVRQISYGDDGNQGFPVSARKFSVGFQGGFDGADPATPQNLEEDITSTNTQGFDASGPEAPGTEAYKKAIGILGNEDQFDINLLVTPGIINNLHGAVVQTGINMVEDRADAFYVFDAAGVNDSIDDAIASISSIDTSYAATYYPWMRLRDNARNKQVRVPPSVLIPRVYAFNDQTAAEWFAPAGFERGGIPEAISAVVRLRRDDRDELYEKRINPIAQFPDQGVSVWGQKTLQTQASALDRVNVRRLLIRVKKFIASTSRFLVFEQNVPETRNRFLNIVNPFLDQVQQQNGLFAFRVKMDADNNPPEVIDRNQLVGEIFLQPTRTAEFIRLTFNVLPTGAEFEDL